MWCVCVQVFSEGGLCGTVYDLQNQRGIFCVHMCVCVFVCGRIDVCLGLCVW